MKKIVYITANTPFGKGEEFVLNEILALRRLGVEITIIPRNAQDELFHKQANCLIKDTLRIPLLNLEILMALCRFIREETVSFFRIVKHIAFQARNPKIAFKNLAVLPKAVYIAKMMKRRSVQHLHAHWGTTTATMAYVIARITGLPWSFTLHRWDIDEDNLLPRKVAAAAFVRCISNKGKGDLLRIIGSGLAQKVKVVHMGVVVPALNGQINVSTAKPLFTIAVPANLKPVKGHIHLIEAVRLLRHREFLQFRCVCFGDGPLQAQLQRQIEHDNLHAFIRLHPSVSQAHLLRLYEKRKIDLVLLPSVTCGNGAAEGIPVSLMEAMAHGIPVIATNTGAIPELIGDGSGIIVPERDPQALADAIENVINDKLYYTHLSHRGRSKIEREFDLAQTVRKMSALLLDHNDAFVVPPATPAPQVIEYE